MSTTAYLALGSNLGDRVENLRQVVRELEAQAVSVTGQSRIYESESVEGGGPGDFLNAVLRVQTELTATELLKVIRGIESTLGRPPATVGEHRPGPRLIDIDILLFGDEVWNEPALEIPHPRMYRRAFVLRPLLDVLEGGWVRPAEADW